MLYNFFLDLNFQYESHWPQVAIKFCITWLGLSLTMCKIHIGFYDWIKRKCKISRWYFLHIEMIFWICWVKYIIKVNLTCLFLLALMERLENFKLYMWLIFMDCVIFLLDGICSSLFFISNLISRTVLSPPKLWVRKLRLRGSLYKWKLPMITQLWLKYKSALLQAWILPIILCCLPRVQKCKPIWCRNGHDHQLSWQNGVFMIPLQVQENHPCHSVR